MEIQIIGLRFYLMKTEKIFFFFSYNIAIRRYLGACVAFELIELMVFINKIM
jgi:hypothetical protein